MGCFLVLFALISPRLALVFLAFVSDTLSRAFDGVLLPLIGFLVLPWTTLAYAVLWAYGTRGVHGVEWAFVVIALLADAGAFAGGAFSRR